MIPVEFLFAAIVAFVALLVIYSNVLYKRTSKINQEDKSEEDKDKEWLDNQW